MIHIILGTKAQLIKMTPIMSELQNQEIDYNFIFTGQHQETMDKLLENFNIKKPDFILYNGKDITRIGQMGIWFIRILRKSKKNQKEIFKDDKNGIVLVHGDTFSTILGSIMGKRAKLNIGHVESGLRSHNIFHPFPEELTRLAVFRRANYFFCPGDWALNNLKKYNGKKINTKENTLLDSLKIAIKNQDKVKVDIPKEKYAVVNIHRFENIFRKKRFNDIINILEDISKEIKLLFILHPPTIKKLEKFNLLEILKNNKNIELRHRYDFFEFIKLVNHSEFIITDGGSNQEESYYLGKPCLLLRKATERQEGLGKNVILSKFNNKIINGFVNNYKKYRYPIIKNNVSPSKLIVKRLGEFI